LHSKQNGHEMIVSLHPFLFKIAIPTNGKSQEFLIIPYFIYLLEHIVLSPLTHEYVIVCVIFYRLFVCILKVLSYLMLYWQYFPTVFNHIGA